MAAKPSLQTTPSHHNGRLGEHKQQPKLIDANLSIEQEKAPLSEWVRITSYDGFSFIVKRDVAISSGTLKSMLNPEG